MSSIVFSQKRKQHIAFIALNIFAVAIAAITDPRSREPRGSSRLVFAAGKVNVRSTAKTFYFKLSRRRAEMSRVGGVCGCIRQRRFKHADERLQPNDSRKYRAIPDLGIDHKRGPLCHLQLVKLCCG